MPFYTLLYPSTRLHRNEKDVLLGEVAAETGLFIRHEQPDKLLVGGEGASDVLDGFERVTRVWLQTVCYRRAGQPALLEGILCL